MTSDRDKTGASSDAEIPLCDITGLSAVLAEASPAVTHLPKQGKELRTVQRYQVKWRATAFVSEQGLHHGFIRDVSVKGAAIFLERNFPAGEFIKLHIYVPPPHNARTPCIVEVYGKVVYVVYDSKEQLFRLGICFLKFNTEHDPVFLEEHLMHHSNRVVF